MYIGEDVNLVVFQQWSLDSDATLANLDFFKKKKKVPGTHMLEKTASESDEYPQNGRVRRNNHCRLSEHERKRA